MNPDLLMAGAMFAASVFIYATGRWLLPKGVRLRIEPVGRSAAREAALSVAHFDLPLEVQPAVRLEVGPVAATRNPKNLCLLCADHHALIHAGIITIAGNADDELIITGDVDRLRFRL